MAVPKKYGNWRMREWNEILLSSGKHNALPAKSR